MHPAPPPDDQDDAGLEQEVELYGPDNGGWYNTRVMDWIGICDDLRDPDFRGYFILRSLVMEKYKNPVRKLTLRILCQLIPGPTKGKPESGLTRVRDILTNLSRVGLVTTPEGEPVKTSSRASALDKPLRLRINDMPPPGYAGWRNTEAKLAAIKGEPVAEAGRKSDPAAPSTQGSGRKSDPRGRKSDPPGLKSDPHSRPDQGKRDLPMVLSLGSSLSGSPEVQESPASVAGEREAAEPKNDNPDRPAADEQTPDVDKVIDAYIAGYMSTANLPPRPDDIRTVRAAAVAQLSIGRSVAYLSDRARELGAKGWTDLVKHVQKNPERASQAVSTLKPWCGECNDRREPLSAAERFVQTDGGGMAKCHCHPGYVPPQSIRA